MSDEAERKRCQELVDSHAHMNGGKGMQVTDNAKEKLQKLGVTGKYFTGAEFREMDKKDG